MSPLAVRELALLQEQRAATAAAMVDAASMAPTAQSVATTPYWARVAEESDMLATILTNADESSAAELTRRLLLALDLKQRFVSCSLERAAIGVVIAELRSDLRRLEWC